MSSFSIPPMGGGKKGFTSAIRKIAPKLALHVVSGSSKSVGSPVAAMAFKQLESAKGCFQVPSTFITLWAKLPAASGPFAVTILPESTTS